MLALTGWLWTLGTGLPDREALCVAACVGLCLGSALTVVGGGAVLGWIAATCGCGCAP